MSGALKRQLKALAAPVSGRDGIVLPAVILVLVMLSTLGAAAILSSDDERRSSRALRESVLAMYAAESGLNEVWATWDDTLVNNLTSGDSVDLGWRNLPDGSSYRVVIHRQDNGGQKMFAMVAEGRGKGALGGRQMMSLALSKSQPKAICCNASAQGGADALEVEGTVDGSDSVPPGWGGVCANTLEDKPGAEWHDASQVTGGTILGTPPVAEDPSLNATSVMQWGDMDFDDLAALATITTGSEINGGIGPTLSGGSCDTSDPDNWGAPEDSTHDCFSHFPIIHAPGDLRIRNFSAAGQGILLVDGNLRIEDNFRFYGIVIVKGEMRDEDVASITGGIITGGRTRIRNTSTVQYSQCAANRAILGNEFLTETERLSSRAWMQPLR